MNLTTTKFALWLWCRRAISQVPVTQKIFEIKPGRNTADFTLTSGK